METLIACEAYIYTAAKRAVQGKADPARALGVPEQVPERLPVPRAQLRPEQLVERDA